jgi:hypothetical protein
MSSDETQEAFNIASAPRDHIDIIDHIEDVPARRDCLKSRNLSQIVARSSHHLFGLIVGAGLVCAQIRAGTRPAPTRMVNRGTMFCPFENYETVSGGRHPPILRLFNRTLFLGVAISVTETQIRGRTSYIMFFPQFSRRNTLKKDCYLLAF